MGGGKVSYTSNLVVGGGELWPCFKLDHAHSLQHNAAAGAASRIDELRCCGLGTFAGCTHAREAAQQMAAAYQQATTR